jgi:DNA-binding transcriptional ArsR family regulator
VTHVLQALATARRRAILRLVWSEERTHGDIHRALPDVTKGAISQHLKRLVDAGLLDSRWAGNYRYFKARKELLGPLRTWLEGMWSHALDRLTLLAELEAERRGPRPRRRQRANPNSRKHSDE